MQYFFPVPLFYFHVQFNALYQFWIHTQNIGKLGPFEWIFNTPSHHRVHHGRNLKYIDKNFGGTLIIFDRMFGTFEEEKETVRYGVTYSIKTWDIFYLQFHHLLETYSTIKKTPGLWNKVRICLDLGPNFNWRTKNYYHLLEAEKRKNEDKQNTREKKKLKPREIYNSNPRNIQMTAYCLINALFSIGLGAVSLIKKDKSDLFQLFSLCYFSYYIFSISKIFDQNKRSRFFEVTRVIIGQIFFSIYITQDFTVITIMGVFNVLCIFWILYFDQENKTSVNETKKKS